MSTKYVGMISVADICKYNSELIGFFDQNPTYTQLVEDMQRVGATYVNFRSNIIQGISRITRESYEVLTYMFAYYYHFHFDLCVCAF